MKIFRPNWPGPLTVGLLLAVITQPASPAQASGSCSSCDINLTYCRSHCDPSIPEQQCNDNCHTSYTGCYAQCNNAWFTYHDWELLGGWSQRERQACYQACHRTGYRNCYEGRLYTSERGVDTRALYDSCIARGSSVDDCCRQLEYLCVDEVACWSL